MTLAQKALTARDIMSVDLLCVSPSTGMLELARLLEDNDISGAPVVDHRGMLVGIVSRTDLVHRCAEGIGDVPPAYLFEMLSEQGDEDEAEIIPEPQVYVEDFMTEDPVTASPDAPAPELAQQMAARNIHRIVIVDEEQAPIGIVTSLDLLRRWPR